MHSLIFTRSALPLDSALIFFFNSSATADISTLSLHDALPIFELLCDKHRAVRQHAKLPKSLRRFSIFAEIGKASERLRQLDRKSTRLNSSHVEISYAVFCLKKKKEKQEK